MNEPTNELADLLISRAIDGDCDPGDWDQLTALADTDTAIWRNLAMSLREHQAFSRAVNADVTVADAIEMPSGEPAVVIEVRGTGRQPATLARIGGWSGWAIAAVFTIAWVAGILNLVQSTTPQPIGTPVAVEAGFAGASASDLFAAYLDKGRQEQFVIAEVPERILIETRPADSGRGYELVYVRQIIERTVVPDLYQFHSQDEMGRPTLVRYDGDRGPSM